MKTLRFLLIWWGLFFLGLFMIAGIAWGLGLLTIKLFSL